MARTRNAAAYARHSYKKSIRHRLQPTNGCNHCRRRQASSSSPPASCSLRGSGIDHIGAPELRGHLPALQHRAHRSSGAPSGLRAPRVASRGSTGAATPDLVAHRLGTEAADPAAKPRSHSHSQELSNQESI